MAEFKLLFLLLISANSFAAVKMYYFKMTDVNGSDNFEHLKKNHIHRLCDHRVEICRSSDTSVCTMRFNDGNMEYKVFNNSCYLFLSNMCDYPGQEYHIIDGGSCDLHDRSRRFTLLRRTNVTTPTNSTGTGYGSDSGNATILYNTTDLSSGDNATSERNPKHRGAKDVLRTISTTRMTPKYEVETAFDEHKCPYSCPRVYSPICIIVNRGEGKYFKYFTFVNHCFGDMYYCKFFDQFEPSPELEYESVHSSPLGWSYCGAYRYLQFARFSESLSAMSHYGWLAGDYKYSHIMEPHQRMPGFG